MPDLDTSCKRPKSYANFQNQLENFIPPKLQSEKQSTQTWVMMDALEDSYILTFLEGLSTEPFDINADDAFQTSSCDGVLSVYGGRMPSPPTFDNQAMEAHSLSDVAIDGEFDFMPYLEGGLTPGIMIDDAGFLPSPQPIEDDTLYVSPISFLSESSQPMATSTAVDILSPGSSYTSIGNAHQQETDVLQYVAWPTPSDPPLLQPPPPSSFPRSIPFQLPLQPPRPIRRLMPADPSRPPSMATVKRTKRPKRCRPGDLRIERKPPNKCIKCQKEVAGTKRDLDRHYISYHKTYAKEKGLSTARSTCPFRSCNNKDFARSDGLTRHLKNKHGR